MTTSWDDGDVGDLRVAHTLATRGLQGTFYLCRETVRGTRLTDQQVAELAAIPGIEVGAHTLSHPDLRRLSDRDFLNEISGSKSWLEDITGREVKAFCYPKGLHRRSMGPRIAHLGFEVARTTMGGCTNLTFDAMRMPTTMQLYPHHRRTQVRHAIKERDGRGLLGVLSARPWSHQPARLLASYATQAERSRRGALHVWGHSWEIQAEELWAALNESLDLLSALEATPVSNTKFAQLSRARLGAPSPHALTQRG